MSQDSPPNLPSVTVVVSARNEAQTIRSCIAALLAQLHVPELIVVVNDGSTDGTAQVLERFANDPRVMVINLERNVGVPSARNIGAAQSRSDIIAFTDADAYATPEWLAELLLPFAEETVACAGGPDRAPTGDRPFALAVDYSLSSLIGSGRLRLKNRFAPYSPAGCNLAIRREVFEACDGFNECLDQRGEEKELLQRIRRAGGRIVYCPEALVWHHRRVSPRRFWRQNFLSGKARVDILRLAPDAFSWPHVAPFLMVALLLAALACYLASGLLLCLVPIGAYLLALLWDAVQALRAKRSWRIAAWVALTSGLIHWGYGIGLMHGCLRLALGKPVGSGRCARGVV